MIFKNCTLLVAATGQEACLQGVMGASGSAGWWMAAVATM